MRATPCSALCRNSELLRVSAYLLHRHLQRLFRRRGEQSDGSKVNVHLHLFCFLVLAVDFDTPYQRIDDLRGELPDVRVIPKCLHQQLQIHLVLLCILQFFIAVSHKLQQLLLLFFVIVRHLYKTLVADLAGDICLKQLLNRLVDHLDAPFTGC